MKYTASEDSEDSMRIPNETKSLLSSGDKSELPKLTRNYKAFRLLIQFLTFVCVASVGESSGPVLPELIAQTDSNYEIMLQAISMRGAGHISGIIGALLIDRLFEYIDLLLAGTVILYTIFGVIPAYVKSIELMFFILLAQGALETLLKVAGFRIVFAVFKEDSAAASNVMQLGYNIGGIVAPAIMSQFVDGRVSDRLAHRTLNSARVDNLSSLINATARIPLEYPGSFVSAYWIISTIGILIALLTLSLHFYDKRAQRKLADYSEVKDTSLKGQFSLHSCSPSHPVITSLFLVMLFLHIGCVFPLRGVFSKIIFSYDREGPGLSVEESGLMTSSYYIGGIGGLIFFLAPSYFFHIKYLIQVQATILLLLTLLMYFFYSNVTALWVLFVGVGTLHGPLATSGMTMVNRYIKMNSVVHSIPHAGAAVGDLLFMYAVGKNYENYGPYSIWSYLLVIGVVIFSVATAMQVLGYFHGDRFEKK